MDTEIHPLVASRLNSQDLAKYVKGIILGSSALIIFFAQRYFQIQLTTDNIVTIASGAVAVIGAIGTIYGVLAKAVAWISTRKTPVTSTVVYTGAGYTGEK